MVTPGTFTTTNFGARGSQPKTTSVGGLELPGRNIGLTKANFGAGAGQSGNIPFPEQTTLANALPEIQNLLPNQGVLNKIETSPISNIDTSQFGDIGQLGGNQFGPVQGLGQDFFDSLIQNANKNLSRQFFEGPNSAAGRQELQATRRGILGTGIEQGGVNELNRSFGDALANVQGEVGRLQAEKQLEQDLANRQFAFDLGRTNKEIEQGNRSFGLDLTGQNKAIEQFNAQQELDTAFKNLGAEFDLSQLGLQAAGDQAQLGTQFDLERFDQQLEERQQLLDQRGDRQQSATDLFGSRDLAEEDRQALIEGVLADLFV